MTSFNDKWKEYPLKSSTYLIQREKAILKLLSLDRKLTRKEFHDLRVELKKLSAFVELVCFSYPRINQKKFFHPWKLIFKSAGSVRELQMQVAIIKKYSGDFKPRFYIKHLNKSITSVREDFSSAITHSLIKNLKRKFRNVHILLAGLTVEMMCNYLHKKEEHLNKLFSPKELKSEDAHELRKQLKIYTYNKAIFISDKQESPFEKFIELVGKWHDLIMIAGKLQIDFDTHLVVDEDWEKLILIRSDLDADCRELFKELSEEYRKVRFHILYVRSGSN